MGYWKSLLPSQDCEGLAGNSRAPTCVTSIVGENCVYVVDPQRPMFPGKETPMNSKNVIANATIAGSFAAALTMITAPAFAAPKPPQPTMDKCYGIAMKGDNDCPAGPGTTSPPTPTAASQRNPSPHVPTHPH